MRLRRGGPPLFLGYLALHALAVAGLVTAEYPDSESYMHLSLTGADTRLPTVPLLYEIFPRDGLRVAVQVLIAAACWWVLASVVSRRIVDRRARVGLRILILALGLAGPIVSWNSAILSESVAISLTALLIAAWLYFAEQPGAGRAAAVVAVTIPWTFARQPHVLVGALIALVVVAWALVASTDRRLRAVLAAALILVSVAGVLEIRRNQQISRANVGSIIQMRILPYGGWTRWFVEHGMPFSRSISTYAYTPFHYHREQNPAYFNWIDTHGTSTYLRFVLEHPHYTLADPLPYFSGEKASLHRPSQSVFDGLQPNPTPSLLSPTVSYARHRDVLPSAVDSLLFDQGQIGDVLTLTLLCVGLGALTWRRGRLDRRYFVPASVALFAIPQGYLIWLAGGEAVGELDRLSMVTAVSLRIGLWTMLGISVDRLCTRRRPPR